MHFAALAGGARPPGQRLWQLLEHSLHVNKDTLQRPPTCFNQCTSYLLHSFQTILKGTGWQWLHTTFPASHAESVQGAHWAHLASCRHAFGDGLLQAIVCSQLQDPESFLCTTGHIITAAAAAGLQPAWQSCSSSHEPQQEQLGRRRAPQAAHSCSADAWAEG